MADPVEVLTTYVHGFRISPPAQAPPAIRPRFEIALTPPSATPPNIAALLPASQTVETVIEDASISLTWAMKNVRFADADIVASTIDQRVLTTIGGMPVSDFLLPAGLATPPDLTKATFGDTTRPGVPGVLGKIGGTIPIAVQRTQSIAAQTQVVHATVRWRIRDLNGAITPVSWSTGADNSGMTGEIVQALGNAPFTPSTLTLTFPVLFEEDTTPPVALPQRRIEAAIRLDAPAAGIATGWVELPPITITLPAVLIPRAAVLTSDVNFGGEVLVVVPGGTPVTSVAALAAKLGTLLTELEPLRGTVPALRIFFEQLGTGSPVANALAATAPRNVLFAAADGLPYLNQLIWSRGAFNTTSTAGDSLSALAFIGPPRRTLQCFNAYDFDPIQGQLNVTTGDGIMTTVGDLHFAAPPCDPPGNISIPRPPTGQRFHGVLNPFRNITTFGHELSSIRFA